VARRRFFVPAVVDGEAVLMGEEAHHLARVLRVEAGQQFEISDGRRVYLGEISSVAKQAVHFRVVEELGGGAELPPITLYVALIKFDRFEWMVEKATEVGVARIVPVDAARSEQGLLAAAAKRVERWRKIARESSQQSRRVGPPEIAEPRKLGALGEVAGLKMRLEEQAGAPLLGSVLRAAEHYSLLVGPEGGWTDAERGIWEPVGLGPAILRAETAAFVGAGVVAQWWYGR
jgi:16S rRNA (uracil1498-N3)-methyltransferase